ncbi:MAG TPA: LacI family DNA-binding transcriptional regulator [Terriglobales bacterium]|jgi:DNA-binding LacI/PurR family transcriptional regulator|nr:LacI family DNA-binding transcriptional regulator [Terriglobales bacterium]
MNIKQVAKRARVSIATVSRTLHNSVSVSPATAARVRRAIKDLDYRPDTNAQTLVSGRSRILGLVVSDITNPFFPELIRGFQDVALQNGYDIMIAATHYESSRMSHSVGRMIERKTDGVAIMTSEMDRSLIDQLAGRKVPLVFLDVGKVRKGVCNIKVDYAQGITQAVDHLRALGHSRIAFISGPSTLKSARVRRDAFLHCLGRRVTEHSGLVEESNHKVDGGLRAITRMLQRQNPPTAVLASNDLTAIGALRGIRQAGLRIPEDVSVIGFDDIDMAQFTEPPLTTIRLLRSELASLACNALLQSIRGNMKGAEFGIGTHLIIRESTGKAKTRRRVIAMPSNFRS